MGFRHSAKLAGVIAAMTLLTACATSPRAETSAQAPTFNAFVSEVLARPEYSSSHVGIEVYSLDRERVLYAFNGEALFVPGSTTKVVTAGTAMALLGPDYRFRTPIYRTGVVRNGVLTGNLVLVASGDPNLSGRAQPDGTLAFVDNDHSYGGMPVSGDPLAALTALARQVSASGIRTVNGSVLVDVSLFGEEGREIGTNVVMSPIAINDNLIDMVVSPGDAHGSPARLNAAPAPDYIRIVNEVTTGAPGSGVSLNKTETQRPDGSIELQLRGSIAADHGPNNTPYIVASPSRMAAALLRAELERHGVRVTDHSWSPAITDDRYVAHYTPENMVAEHVSAPFREDVRVTLKTSQNLHAGMMPYIVGAVVGGVNEHADRRGIRLGGEWLERNGVSLTGAAQGDGAGFAAFTPDFMVRYLAFMATQPYFNAFHDALPVLGRDGTLVDVVPTSPAAGAVSGKTGTFALPDWLRGEGAGEYLYDAAITVYGKGLVGYTTTPSGERVAFAIYINMVPSQPGNTMTIAGQAIGEIAAAAHLMPIVEQR